MFKKCKHDWEVKSEKFVPALINVLVEQGSRMKNIPLSVLESTHIVIMVCKKCGKIDKTITRC